ncbi:MAG: glycosyltransferase [bacterium]|nr:glycosyltransferase [bacterium]
MKYPLVSIIFPTFNGWQDTLNCVKSIMELDYPRESLELIIVDNASTDETVNAIQNYQLPITNYQLLKNNINLGFAKAVNRGIKHAKGEYLLITNNDIIFDKDYLKNLVEYAQAHPLAGIIGGKVYLGKLKNKFAFSGARFNFYTGTLKLNKDHNKIAETDWVPGCNLFTSRKTLETIGLFDERFFFYFEDLDLCLRAKKQGFKVIYYPKAVMYHKQGASIKREGWQKDAEVYYQGKFRVLLKHANKLQLLASFLFHFSLGSLFQLLILRRLTYSISVKALSSVIKSSKSIVPQLPIPNSQFPIPLPSVSVVFPTHNAEKIIRPILDSIQKQNYPKEKIEIIAVDNASSDKTVEIIKNKYPKVKLIQLNTNTGSAPPITIGAKEAKGDYVLATNDDVVFDKNFLLELVKLGQSDNRAGIITGKMMSQDKPPKPLFFGFKNNLYFGYYPYDFSNKNKIRECDWAAGACHLIKKDLFKKIGYYDDDYIFCGDDYDACFQVRKLGYKILYNPKAIYYHRFNSLSRPSPSHLFAHYRGKIRFMLKNASFLQMLTFFPFQIIFIPLLNLSKGRLYSLFPIYRALFWNLRHFDQTNLSRKEANKRRALYWQNN